MIFDCFIMQIVNIYSEQVNLTEIGSWQLIDFVSVFILLLIKKFI